MNVEKYWFAVKEYQQYGALTPFWLTAIHRIWISELELPQPFAVANL
jgi:hypothetical protein